MAEKKDPALEKTKARMKRETDKIGEAAEVLSGKKPIAGSMGKGSKAKAAQSFDQFLNEVETGFAAKKGEKVKAKEIKIRKLN